MGIPDGLYTEGGPMHFPRPTIALENNSGVNEPDRSHGTFISAINDGEWKYLGMVRDHTINGDGWHYTDNETLPTPCPTALDGINTILRSAGVIQ